MKLMSKNTTEINRHELVMEVSPEEFNTAIDKVYKKDSKKINVPGFRKGKAPRKFIEKYYGEQVFFESAVDDLYRSIVTQAIDDSELEVISVTGFDIEEIGLEKGITCKLTVVTKPEVTIENYKEIEVKKPSEEISEEEIDAEIQRIRERNSRVVVVENRSVQDGDIAVIDFDGYVDDVAFEGGKAENHELTIGAGQFIPGFEDQVIGHNVDDAFDVNVTFPEDYHAEELKGKAAVFKVKLHEIKRKELPELDDEFVKDISEFDTMEAYRADTKNNLHQQKIHSIEHEIEDQLVKAVIERVQGEIPEEMIQNEVDEMINSFAYRLQSQGLNLETYLKYTGMTTDNMREQYKEQAENQVKVRLGLEKIASLEDIKADEEDLNAEYKKLAEAYNMPEDNVKNLVTEKQIRTDIVNQKAIKFLQEHAVITEVSDETEPAAEETPAEAE